jgi:cardiolipin synthase
MKIVKYIPNTLTIIRFLFVPFIIWAITQDNYTLALILYTLSSVTDVVDGIIARKFNVISDFGKLMDPLADKLNQLSVLLTFAIKGIIPAWVIALLLVKEIFMIIGASFLYGKKLVVSSKWYGKLTTVFLFLGVISSLVTRIFSLPRFDIYIYAVTIILAIYSLFSYYMYFYKQGYLMSKKDLKAATKVSQGPKRKLINFKKITKKDVEETIKEKEEQEAKVTKNKSKKDTKKTKNKKDSK